MYSSEERETSFCFQEELSSWKQKVEEASQVYARRRYAQAETMFLDALKQAESWPKAGSAGEQRELETALSKSLNNLAAAYQVQGKYALAEEMYGRSLSLNEVLFGKNSTDYALNLQNIAACISARGRFAEAEVMFQDALAIREGILGKDHPDLATTLTNLALLLRKMDRPDEASVIADRAKHLVH